MRWTANSKKMLKEETFVEGGVKQMSPEFVSIVQHDPQQFYPKIKCPVLALNGGRDIQVLPELNLKGWEDGLKQAGNNRITTRSFEGLNHLFQHCKACTVQEYGQLTRPWPRKCSMPSPHGYNSSPASGNKFSRIAPAIVNFDFEYGR